VKGNGDGWQQPSAAREEGKGAGLAENGYAGGVLARSSMRSGGRCSLGSSTAVGGLRVAVQPRGDGSGLPVVMRLVHARRLCMLWVHRVWK
jgi:hypothetical protein